MAWQMPQLRRMEHVSTLPYACGSLATRARWHVYD